jgi:hypothetical protein
MRMRKCSGRSRCGPRRSSTRPVPAGPLASWRLCSTYLHYELINQVSTEDWQLLPLADRVADRPQIDRLGREHTWLRAAVEALA